MGDEKSINDLLLEKLNNNNLDNLDIISVDNFKKFLNIFNINSMPIMFYKKKDNNYKNISLSFNVKNNTCIILLEFSYHSGFDINYEIYDYSKKDKNYIKGSCKLCNLKQILINLDYVHYIDNTYKNKYLILLLDNNGDIIEPYTKIGLNEPKYYSSLEQAKENIPIILKNYKEAINIYDEFTITKFMVMIMKVDIDQVYRININNGIIENDTYSINEDYSLNERKA